MLLFVGEWREQCGGPDALWLREAVREQPHPDEPRILAYLHSGHCFGAGGMELEDVLDPTCSVFVGNLYTDGVYYWNASLEYYVKKYHAELPAEFIAHMRANNWIVPFIPDKTLGRLLMTLGRDDSDWAPYPELENPTGPTEPFLPPP